MDGRIMTKKLNKTDQLFLKNLGAKIRKIILQEKGYASLDAFALEHHDHIAKGTLYEICNGERDMKFSTLRSLCRALNVTFEGLIKGV